MCCDLSSPKSIAGMLLRVGFGISLALFGLVHYLNIGDFVGFVQSDLGVLTPLGTLWAYVLPALQIVGGVLLVAKYRLDLAAWAVGIALVSIVIGMPLKAVVGTGDLMALSENVHFTFIWLLVYMFVIKCSSCCGSSCKKEGGQQTGGHGCSSC